jgi:hypothetical protein
VQHAAPVSEQGPRETRLAQLVLAGLPAGHSLCRGNNSRPWSAPVPGVVDDGDRVGSQHVVVEVRALSAAAGEDQVALVMVTPLSLSGSQSEVLRSRTDTLMALGKTHLCPGRRDAPNIAQTARPRAGAASMGWGFS